MGQKKAVRVKDKLLKVFGLNDRRPDNADGDTESIAPSIDPGSIDVEKIRPGDKAFIGRRKPSAGYAASSASSAVAPSKDSTAAYELSQSNLTYGRSSASTFLAPGTRGS